MFDYKEIMERKLKELEKTNDDIYFKEGFEVGFKEGIEEFKTELIKKFLKYKYPLSEMVYLLDTTEEDIQRIINKIKSSKTEI